MSGEFIGTVLFLWFAFAGTQVAAMSNPSGSVLQPQGIVYISLSFGMSLLVVAFAFYRISGGLFNPAVTCGMMVCGALPVMRGLFLIPAQFIGGIVAAALVSCMLPGPLAVVTNLTNGTSIAQGLFIEMFLTALLVFVILMLAGEKSSATPIAPVGIGLALFVAELAGVYFTGGALNPARAFGPSVVARSFPGYHWLYWLGPVMGGVLAGGYYKWLKYMEYEQVNPGQDATSEREKARETARTQSQMDMEA